MTGIFVTNTSPPLALTTDFSTSLAASGTVMTKRVILLSVMVKGPPFLIWRTKRGTTEPREPITLPNLVLLKILRPSFFTALAAVISFSPISFEVPITLVGFTALSLLVKSTYFTPQEVAALIMFSTPTILVWTTSNGLYSERITCFKAAQWIIISMPFESFSILSLSLTSPVKQKTFRFLYSSDRKNISDSLLSTSRSSAGFRE